MARKRSRRFTLSDYEQPKRDFIARYPLATPEQYQQAMQRIAERMGL